MIRTIRSVNVEGIFGRIKYLEMAGNSLDTKPTTGVATGSLFTEADTGKLYIYDETTAQWYETDAGGGSGGITIHICGQGEVDAQGKPNIQNPDPKTIYLVPTTSTGGNLYDEYIYVNDAWEPFGSGDIDLSGYAPTADPVFTGSISLGRKANTTVGTGSVAIGTDAQASGNYSNAFGSNVTANSLYAHAEGCGTTASNSAAHAEGDGTTASGARSHAEGYNTIASGANSHAEGYGGAGKGALGKADHAEGYSTKANSGSDSSSYGAHAEGKSTTATANGAHAEGGVTTASGPYAHAEGYGTTASGNYSHAEGADGKATAAYAHCEGYSTRAASSSQHAGGKYNIQDSSGVYAEIIGNGTDDDARSNARTLDWSGNGWYAGNVTAAGGSLTLGSGNSAVTMTAQQLSDLLSLASATGVNF